LIGMIAPVVALVADGDTARAIGVWTELCRSRWTIVVPMFILLAGVLTPPGEPAPKRGDAILTPDACRVTPL
jgi:hypothetical protein